MLLSSLLQFVIYATNGKTDAVRQVPCMKYTPTFTEAALRSPYSLPASWEGAQAASISIS